MEDYLNELHRFDSLTEQIRKKKDKYLNAWLKAECTIKPGDVIKIDNSYGYRGKKMYVDSVIVAEKHNRYVWIARGRVVKADGHAGRRRIEEDIAKFDKIKDQ